MLEATARGVSRLWAICQASPRRLTGEAWGALGSRFEQGHEVRLANALGSDLDVLFATARQLAMQNPLETTDAL